MPGPPGKSAPFIAPRGWVIGALGAIGLARSHRRPALSYSGSLWRAVRRASAAPRKSSRCSSQAEVKAGPIRNEGDAQKKSSRLRAGARAMARALGTTLGTDVGSLCVGRRQGWRCRAARERRARRQPTRLQRLQRCTPAGRSQAGVHGGRRSRRDVAPFLAIAKWARAANAPISTWSLVLSNFLPTEGGQLNDATMVARQAVLKQTIIRVLNSPATQKINFFIGVLHITGAGSEKS